MARVVTDALPDGLGVRAGRPGWLPLLLGLAACASPKISPSADSDGDGVLDAVDCAPDDASRSQTESAFADADLDGFGDATAPLERCGSEPGTALEAGDCDDSASGVHPGAEEIWYDGADEDCSGGSDFDQDGDGYDRDDECDDTDPALYPNPNVIELWYNGVDENCDGNDGDQDEDGWYIADYPFDVPARYSTTVGDCWDDPAAGSGWVAINGFADPPASDVHPGTIDPPYDGLDEDCAGDDDFDADVDGFRTTSWPDLEGRFGDDCDDGEGNTYPGAPDPWYDGVDEDCAGNNDNDADYDGSEGGSADAPDCDDADPGVHPGAIEVCGDGRDDDCDGTLNGETMSSATIFYADADGDSWGTTSSRALCVAEAPYSATRSGDCDDGAAGVFPGATETCDGVDEDCDGAVDDGASEWYGDNDGDGYGAGSPGCYSVGAVNVGGDCDDASVVVYPGAPELCDGQSNACEGSWTSADEDGSASVLGADGHWDDVTATLAAGTASLPSAYILPEDGALYVCAGSWFVTLTAPAGPSSIIAPAGASRTLLDAASADSVVTVDEPGASLSIEGVTLRGGAASKGGGLYIVGADVTLTDSTIESCTAALYGGAIFMSAGSLTISGATLEDNGAGTAGGAIYSSESDLSVDDSAFATNIVRSASSGYGGALWFASTGAGSLGIVGGSFTDNAIETASGDVEGGGVYAYSFGSGSIDIDGVTFTANTLSASGHAYGAGGRLLVSGTVGVTITDSTFEQNRAQAGGAGYGGGLDLYSGSSVDIEVSGGILADNSVYSSSVPYGGGLFYGADGTGGLVCNGVSVVDNNALDEAGRQSGYAGGVYLEAHGNDAVFSGVLIAGNDANLADGMFIIATDGAQITLDGGTDVSENAGMGVLYDALDARSELSLAGASIRDHSSYGLYSYAGASGAVAATVCEGSSSDRTGLWGNSYGYVGDCAGYGGVCTFEASSCDFGEPATAYDNASGDVAIDGAAPLTYGDDVNFSCVGTVCG